jgi:hypothetical protein
MFRERLARKRRGAGASPFFQFRCPCCLILLYHGKVKAPAFCPRETPSPLPCRETRWLPAGSLLKRAAAAAALGHAACFAGRCTADWQITSTAGMGRRDAEFLDELGATALGARNLLAPANEHFKSLLAVLARVFVDGHGTSSQKDLFGHLCKNSSNRLLSKGLHYGLSSSQPPQLSLDPPESSEMRCILLHVESFVSVSERRTYVAESLRDSGRKGKRRVVALPDGQLRRVSAARLWRVKLRGELGVRLGEDGPTCVKQRREVTRPGERNGE